LTLDTGSQSNRTSMNNSRELAVKDDGERIHDQLPTVEEIHAGTKRDLNRTRSCRNHICRRKIFYIFLVILIIVCLSLSIALIVSRTEDPKDAREKLVQKFLDTVSSSDDLSKDGSPQQFASRWISRHDLLELTVPERKDDNNYRAFITRYAAAVLYFSLGGSEWNDNCHFLSDKGICEWNKQNELVMLGIVCDDNNEPKDITMPSNNMIGTIPTEIGLLTSLEILVFKTNKVSGTLPSEMVNLQNLRGALFSTNELSGSIPAWLGKLSNLEWLSMPNNDFSGSIPNELGSMSMLKWLDFQVNINIVGTIPDTLQNLTHLESIFLSYNNLEGSIPAWIGNFANLSDLRLSNNKLSSSIPNSLSNAAQLHSLFLDDNNLTGDLNVIESLNNLEYLLVEDNNFEQSLNSDFLASLNKLRVLDASNNKLKGTLPSHLFQMDKLQVLDLHGNQIEGNLPDFPMNNVLEVLALYENSIEGSIPLSISNLKNVTHLDLSTNKLTGVFPASIGDMTSLTYLFMASNEFDAGPIPDYFQNLLSLRELSLKGTSRNGNIPDWIGGFQKLILLDLDNNNLIGAIPETMKDLEELAFLLLNRNQLSGTVPADISLLPKLRILLINENDISGLGSNNDSLNFCDNIVGTREASEIVFTSDCGGSSPVLECTCCTECCGNDDALCNDGSDFLANHDLIWEAGYNRLKFEFSDDITYVVRNNGI